MRIKQAILTAAVLVGLEQGVAEGRDGFPKILAEPCAVAVREGEYAQFQAFVRGALPLAQQWYQVLTNASAANPVTTNLVFASQLGTGGQTYAVSAVLQFTATATNLTGGYFVIITNLLVNPSGALVAGAVTSSVATLQVRPYTSRELRVAGFQTNGAGQAIFPLDFAAQGDETNLTGSLVFSPDVLQNPQVTVPAGTNAPQVQVDTSHAGAGALGLSVSWPATIRASAGVQRVATVAFQLKAGAAVAQAGLAWANQPVPLGAMSASVASLPLEPQVVPAFFADAAPPRLDPQTGLFVKTGTLINPGGSLPGVSILFLGLTNDSNGIPITARTAVFDTNGLPSMRYGPIPAGASNTWTFEYYVSDRATMPTNTFDVTVKPPVYPLLTTNRLTLDRAQFHDATFIVEFITALNHAYYVQYRNDLSSPWLTSLPMVSGSGTRLRWVDRGPPRTDSAPTNQNNRYYQVFW